MVDDPFILPYCHLSNFGCVCFVSSLAIIFSNTLPGAGVRDIVSGQKGIQVGLILV